MEDDDQNIPIHIALSEPPRNFKQRAAVPGQSVRIKGYLHDFASLIPLYGSVFVASLLDGFTRHYALANPATSVKKSGHLRRLLSHLATKAISEADRNAPVVKVYNALCNGTPEVISREDMVDAANLFFAPLRDLQNRSVVDSANKLSRQNIIESLSAALQELASQSLWPDIGPVRGLSGSRAGDTEIVSLGEVLRSEESISSIENHSELVDRSRRRLTRLRQLCETMLLREQENFDNHQRLISETHHPTLAEIQAAIDELPTDYDRKNRKMPLPPQVDRCFPLADDTVRKSSLLRYIKAELGGVFRLQQLPVGLQRVVAKCGGTASVMACLEGGSRALMAAYTLVLIDTGFNIQPCDDLAADPFTGKAKRGKITLRRASSVKNRAGSKAVSGHIRETDDADELEAGTSVETLEIPLVVPNTTISGAQAITIWKRLSEPQRARARAASNPDADLLWIIRNGNSPTEVNRYLHSAWKSWWADFLNEHGDDPVIGGLPINRRMIRKTLQQLNYAKHNGDAEIVALLAGQSRARTSLGHYISKAFIKHILDQEIRKFQNLFEADVAGDAPERASQLGISDDEFNRRRRDAADAGLGLTQIDQTPEGQVHPTGTVRDSDGACGLLCPMLQFRPTPQSIKALVHFHRSLSSAEAEFVTRSPERWIRVWLPALALCIAITSLLEGGSKRRLLRSAQSEIERELADNTLTLFQPW